jgi:hypothetical protein
LIAVAWIALIAGISWFITFGTIIKAEVNGEVTTQGYKSICFLCLITCVTLSLIVNLGVIFDGAG